MSFLIFLLASVQIWYNADSLYTCPEPDAGPDLIICDPGQLVRLQGSIQGSFDRFYWEPMTGLNPPNSLTPTVTVNQTTTYRLVVESTSNVNLITNGDFASGNTGFSSEYIYYPPGSVFTDWGVYTVHNRPSDCNGGFSNCNDISGEGLMFISDAALTPGVNFWCQTVPVQPNTTYEFSFWGTSVHPASPSVFQVKFDGTPGGGPFGNAASPCVWQRYTTRWNSGGSASVEICLEDLNIDLGGNDFAIDDIRLVEICERYDEVTVEVIEILADAGGPYEINCDFPVIQLDGSGSSQGAGYSYEWMTFNGRITGGANTLFPNVDKPGTYILTVFGPGGCEKQISVEVNGSTQLPILRPQAPDSIGCGTDSVRLSVQILPQNQIYTYEWTGPGGFNSQAEGPWVYAPGTYYITVTDLFGCSQTDSVTVEPGPGVPRVESYYQDTLNCFTDSIQLKVDPLVAGQFYEWKGPNGFTSLEPEPMVGDTGWYVVVSGNDPKCLGTDSIRVSGKYAAAPLSLSADTLSCLRDSVRLRIDPLISGEYYEWRGPKGYLRQEAEPMAGDTGWYVVIAGNDPRCQGVDSIRITGDYSVRPVALEADTLTCLSDSIELNARLDSIDIRSWEWIRPDGSISKDSLLRTPYSGWHYLRTTFENGCSGMDSIRVEADSILPIFDLQGDTITCARDYALISAVLPAGSLGIEWSGPGQFSSVNEFDTVRVPGWYFATVSGANGCAATDSLHIETSGDIPGIDLIPDTLDCFQSLIELQWNSPNTGLSFQWSGPGGFSSSASNPEVSEPGTYILVLTNSQNCRIIDSVQIDLDKSEPIFEINSDSIDCNNNSASIFLTGSQSFSLIEWIDPMGNVLGTGPSFDTDSGGTYRVRVTGKNGCQSDSVFTIKENKAIPSIQLSGDTINCLQAEIWISLAIEDQAGSLVWSGPEVRQVTPDSVLVGSGGTYMVEFTGENGCITRQQIDIPVDTMGPVFALMGDSLLYCLQKEAAIGMTPVSSGWLTEWVGPAGNLAGNGPDLIVDSPGTYRLKVTDPENGCFEEREWIIKEALPPNDLEIVSERPDCFADEGRLSILSVRGGVGPFFYTINGESANLGQAFRRQPGNYLIEVTDALGCQYNESVSIPDRVSPSITLVSSIQVIPGQYIWLRPSLNIDSSALASIVWTPVAKVSCPNCLNTMAMPDISETYTITLRDTAGCTTSASIFLRVERPEIFIPNAFSPHNKDGTNDFFLPGTGIGISVESMQIFDRWGGLIWQKTGIGANDPNDGWDGTSGGRQMLPGSYVYRIGFRMPDGSMEHRVGDVTLIN